MRLQQHFYQLKFCPDKFQLSLKPYAKSKNNQNKSNATLILVKDLTSEKIDDYLKVCICYLLYQVITIIIELSMQ